MAGRDLRALFSSNDPGLAAEEAFTNRQMQWRAVVGALTAHLHHVAAPGFDVEDLESARRNVLVFHGVGGIGKTTLSRKIEAALTGSAQRPAAWPGLPVPEQVLPVRVDLARSAGADFEHVVLSLRLALAGLGRPMPAFDVALRRYWEHNHPGEPLEEYLRRGGLASRFAAAVNLPEQMQSALSDVAQALTLPGTVGGAVGQLTASLVTALRERRQAVRALAGCARLADILEAEPDLDTLSFAAHLLAWDLAQVPEGRQVVPVVLFDAFEEIGDRVHRDFERLIQRVVWLMPNAFFVITGRDRLQWADPGLQGQLDWTGPDAWPGLDAADEATGSGDARAGRQLLIGDFSPEDCEDHLARRLQQGGQPLIGDSVRRVITARSHGLPLYLDLAVMRFLEIRRGGRDPQPADFDHDFPALISRTVSDLTPDERHVLRSVSLLDAFSLPLATQAAGLSHEAAALRLIERPFIREAPTGIWPYHLHQVVRSAIRNAEDHTDDRWSPRDWQQAAERAFTALGEQLAHGTAPGRVLLVGCLRQGLLLARDFHLELGWLADATWNYVGDSVWEPLAPPSGPDAGGGLGSAADALVELLSTLARRQRENRERTAVRLTAVIDSSLLPRELHEMAVYYRAKAQRDLGRTAESQEGMQLVAAGDGRLAPAARRGMAHLARLAGDFPTAFEAAGSLGWEGRHHRVKGDVWWPQGEVAAGAEEFQAARQEGEKHGKAGEAAMSQAMRAFCSAFADPERADDDIELAEQLLSLVDLRAATLDARTAGLLRDAGRDDADLLDRARVLQADIDTSGLAFAHAKLQLALAFHHAIRDNQAELADSIDRLRELTGPDYYAYYVDIAHFMAGLPLEDTSPAQWLDGAEATRQRWRALVTTRRLHLEL